MPLHEEHKKRKGRNFTLAAILGGLVFLFFMVTLVKLGVI
tara:strand:- start:231 stop:350 length:120 start_codon:yes stop_codon:yes gene_type:complete